MLVVLGLAEVFKVEVGTVLVDLDSRIDVEVATELGLGPPILVIVESGARYVVITYNVRAPTVVFEEGVILGPTEVLIVEEGGR